VSDDVHISVPVNKTVNLKLFRNYYFLPTSLILYKEVVLGFYRPPVSTIIIFQPISGTDFVALKATR
jgi:hypothetical protein